MTSTYTTTNTRSVGVWVASILCIALACGSFLRADATDRRALSDARCVVVGLRLAEKGAPDQRVAGTMLAVYYLGRLDSQAAGADVEALIAREAEKMTPLDLRANSVRCGKAIAAKGQEIQNIGADLSHKAQEGAAKK
jgi:hypothetical protein